MAKHRVGDSYLFNQEFRKFKSTQGKILTFLFGAVIIGNFVNSTLLDMGWNESSRLALDVIAALVGGAILASFSEIIIKIVTILSVTLSIVLLLCGIWQTI